MKNTVTIKIEGLTDKALIGAIRAIVEANNASITISEGSDQTTKTSKAKAATAKTKTKAKTPKGVTILKVDKYGNQWIKEYDPVVYAKAKADAIANGTYDSKNRSAIYKALGWIL